MKNYYGFAFEDCSKGFSEKHLKSKSGKKYIKKCKKQKKEIQKPIRT